MRNRNRAARMGPSIVFAVPLALLSMLAMAGSNSTTLSNGASLSVSVDSPVTSTEFEVPPGQPNIDVAVNGTASVGIGNPDNTFVYILDSSGSTINAGGACGTILACEKTFFIGLNNAVAADGSTDEVGFVSFGDNAAIHDMQTAGGFQNFTTPGDPNVDTVINSPASGGGTNCAEALDKATILVGLASNSHKAVVFASDGLCNTGGFVGPSADALGLTGAVVNAIAIGKNSSCTTDDGRGRLDQIPKNGGTCVHVEDPNDLPDLIDNLIGSKLNSLDISVDGGAPQPITNTSLPLPQNGAVSVNYTTSADDLGPGDHTICVTAHGSDSTGGTASVTQCETIHLLQLSAAPAEATNQLGALDNTHTVTATIAGPASHIGGRTVSFSVTGTNAGATGVCSPTPDCKTDPTGNVSFTYSVPVAPSSLGTDTIHVSTLIAGNTSAVSVIKHWVDTTPPVAACPESVNPSGGNVPNAHNEDGFFQLTATDAVDPNPKIFVVDLGTGTVFGPFASGTNVKYTQAPGATPSISPGAGAVDWKIKGQGDMGVYAVDGSGNQSATVSCLVPPPPK
jgi:hypothetical protein